MQCFDNRPIKIEGVKPIEQTAPKSKAQSAWNQAGTWEDRTLKRDQLEKIIQ